LKRLRVGGEIPYPKSSPRNRKEGMAGDVRGEKGEGQTRHLGCKDRCRIIGGDLVASSSHLASLIKQESLPRGKGEKERLEGVSSFCPGKTFNEKRNLPWKSSSSGKREKSIAKREDLTGVREKSYEKIHINKDPFVFSGKTVRTCQNSLGRQKPVHRSCDGRKGEDGRMQNL